MKREDPKLIALIDKKSPVYCYVCGATMVYKQNHKTGKIFLGCGNYPDCDRTMNLPESLRLEITHPKLPGF